MNALSIIDARALSLLPLSDSAHFLAAMKVLTHAGDARFIAIIAVALAFVLWRRGAHALWAGLAVSIVGAATVTWLLKWYIARPRPLYPLVEATGYSLPSMHAAVSVALYGYLIFVTMRRMHPPHHRVPFAAALAALAFFVCLSRVYLGVHYASDVLAGIPIGALALYVGYRTQRALAAPKQVRQKH